jgi:hypothetical protein
MLYIKLLLLSKDILKVAHCSKHLVNLVPIILFHSLYLQCKCPALLQKLHSIFNFLFSAVLKDDQPSQDKAMQDVAMNDMDIGTQSELR